jgi:hypothetical protein
MSRIAYLDAQESHPPRSCHAAAPDGPDDGIYGVTFTGTDVPTASAAFGRVTCNTPCLNVASTRFGSAIAGRRSVRENAP